MPRRRVFGRASEAHEAQTDAAREVVADEVPAIEVQTQASARMDSGIVTGEVRSEVPTVMAQSFITRMYPGMWTVMPPPIDGCYGMPSQTPVEVPGERQIPVSTSTQRHGQGVGARVQDAYPDREVQSPSELAVNQFSRRLERARQLGCSRFNGTGDGTVAQRWLGRIVRAAVDMRLSDADRVTLATRLLEGEAELWWDSVQSEHSRQVPWDDFFREFRAQYPSPRQRDRMVIDFYVLTQDDRTVLGFETELRRLSRALPQSERTEALLAQRFLEGLSTEVRAGMRADISEGYDALVTAAVRAELAAVQRRPSEDHGQDPGGRRMSSRSQHEQSDGSQGSSTARTGRSQSHSSRSRRSVSQAQDAEPEATLQMPVGESPDRARSSRGHSDQRQTSSQQARVRPSGPRMRGQAWRPPRGVSSRSGTPSTREISEAPPLESRFRSGFFQVLQAEYFAPEEAGPSFPPGPSTYEVGGPSRPPVDARADGSSSDDYESDPSEEI